MDLLHLHISSKEYYDYDTERFVYTPETNIVLEHSLYTIAEWESKWKKPYASRDERSEEESISYLDIMAYRNGDEAKGWATRLSIDEADKVREFMEDSMTATTFSVRLDAKTGGSGSTPTAEVFYYLMSEFNIPYSCEHWHFNRLETLIRVCSEKKNPEELSAEDVAKNNAKLNAERRAKYEAEKLKRQSKV